MRFWHALAFTDPHAMLDIARACDDVGIHGVTVSDHLFYPAGLTPAYPYSDTGMPGFDEHTDWIDPFVVIPAMAAVTTRLHFTTNVFIGPLRNPFLLAKTVGSAAFLSGDRVALGVGVGWMAEEFAAAGEDFHTRGRRLDEMIELMRLLWRGGMQEFHGRFYETAPIRMNPAPSKPVPIYVGGHSPPALRRATELADGWIAASAYRPEEAWQHLEAVQDGLRKAGREHEPFEIVMALHAVPDVDLYRRFEDAGVTSLLCAPAMFATDQTPDGRRRAIEDFAERVVAPLA